MLAPQQMNRFRLWYCYAQNQGLNLSGANRVQRQLFRLIVSSGALKGQDRPGRHQKPAVTITDGAAAVALGTWASHAGCAP